MVTLFSKKGRTGFTLIELLVVISIIGILASIILASLSSARAKSRDARRITDIKQIQLALELYFDGIGQRTYPQTIAETVPLYISVEPKDPVGNTPYQYAYNTVGGSIRHTYHLGVSLEQLDNPALNGDRDCNSTTGDNCPDTGGVYSGGSPFNGASVAGAETSTASGEGGRACDNVAISTRRCYDLVP